jgi:hypothetical protein
VWHTHTHTHTHTLYNSSRNKNWWLKKFCMASHAWNKIIYNSYLTMVFQVQQWSFKYIVFLVSVSQLCFLVKSSKIELSLLLFYLFHKNGKSFRARQNYFYFKPLLTPWTIVSATTAPKLTLSVWLTGSHTVVALCSYWFTYSSKKGRCHFRWRSRGM